MAFVPRLRTTVVTATSWYCAVPRRLTTTRVPSPPPPLHTRFLASSSSSPTPSPRTRALSLYLNQFKSAFTPRHEAALAASSHRRPRRPTIISAFVAAGAPRRRLFSSVGAKAGPRSYYGSQGSTSSGRGGGGWGGSGRSSFRRRIDSLSPNVVLFSLIGLNAGVFFAWQYATSVAQQFRDLSWIRFMKNNFTSSWRNLQQGRVWTLLTCCFSHEGTAHILMNLASLYFMAPPVIMMLGNSGFLALYLFAGLVSSTVSLMFSRFNHQPFYQSRGASGAVYGTIAFFAAAYPRTTFLLFFVVPVPAWLCVGGILGYDLYSAFFRRGGTTDSAGHVGGVAAGIMWFLRKAGRF